MPHQKWIGVVLFVVAFATVAFTQQRLKQEKGGEEETGPYEAVPGWPQPISKEWTWGRTASIWAESPDRVYVFQTGMLPRLEKPVGDGGVPVRPAASFPEKHSQDHKLMVFDWNGKLVESWEQNNKLWVKPDAIVINPYDPERHIWTVDSTTDQVLEFTHSGKLVMTLGVANVDGNDKTHFGGPNAIAFLPNGDFYVSDGYRNSRIVKFSKDGKYLMEWGKPGKGPGELNLPHSLAIDAQQRIYVGDRGNSRIQVFDSNGKFLDVWPNVRFPLFIAVSQDQHLWVSDGLTQKILKYDLEGHLLYAWGTFGAEPGQMWGTHSFSIDSEGNLYTAEVWGGRAQKFRPRRGADPSKLMARLLPLPTAH